MNKRRSDRGVPIPRNPFTAIAPPSVSRPYERPEQISRIQFRDTLADQLRVRNTELDLLDEDLQNLGSPSGVAFGIFALTAFALLGIVFPLCLMALRPVPDSTPVRAAAIAAFVVGLVLLMSFIWFQRRTLRGTPFSRSSCGGAQRDRSDAG